MPKMYPIIERYPDIAMAYYKGLNCFLELLVCNNHVSYKDKKNENRKLIKFNLNL
jgi:hypothetical protein